MTVDKIGFLKKVPLFSGISSRELKIIADIAAERKYRKGTYLFFENEVGNMLFIIVSGLVKIYKSDITGKTKTLSFLRTGDFFGEMSMLDDEIRSASAQVLEDTHVFAVQRDDFQKKVMKNPLVALKIMKTLSARLREADRQIHDIVFRNLPGRVARTLLDLSEKYGVKQGRGTLIDLKLTHKELAEMVGTAREVVSAVLGQFRKAECIKIDSHHITLTNKKELSTWIN